MQVVSVAGTWRLQSCCIELALPNVVSFHMHLCVTA